MDEDQGYDLVVTIGPSLVRGHDPHGGLVFEEPSFIMGAPDEDGTHCAVNEALGHAARAGARNIAVLLAPGLDPVVKRLNGLAKNTSPVLARRMELFERAKRDFDHVHVGTHTPLHPVAVASDAALEP